MKDSKRFAETNGWGFFTFGHHPLPYDKTAAEKPVTDCAGCHIANVANTDMTWIQFYPLLRDKKRVLRFRNFLSAWLSTQNVKSNLKEAKGQRIWLQKNISKQMGISKEMSMNGQGGHLYMQTNQVKNAIIHYHRSPNGTLTEVDRVATGGAGSGTYKPISGQESAPNSFEGAASVILSPDRKFSVYHKRRGQFGFQLSRGRPGQAHTNRHQTDRERGGRKERYCRIAGIFSLEGDALRGPLLRTRSYPAHVGLQ